MPSLPDAACCASHACSSKHNHSTRMIRRAMARAAWRASASGRRGPAWSCRPQKSRSRQAAARQGKGRGGRPHAKPPSSAGADTANE
eukprot:14099764-Alexandrium_andersonii.AAC.1